MKDEEIEILQIYQSNAQKLREAAKKHITGKMTVSYKVDKPIEFKGEIESMAEVGIVSSARLFLSEREPAKFTRVVNIISEHCCNDKEKFQKLREYRKIWKLIFGPHRLFRIGTEEDELTNWAVFDMIAHGSHIHTGLDKFKKHSNFKQSWIYPMLKIQLYSLIMDIQRLTTMLEKEFVEPILESEFNIALKTQRKIEAKSKR